MKPFTPPTRAAPVQFGPLDLHLFNEGTHLRLYEKLGAHPVDVGGQNGTRFSVWAPNAEQVSVIGDFNGWDPDASPLSCLGASGIWTGAFAGVDDGGRYKYHVRSRLHGVRVDKADPFGFYHEEPPRTASIVHRFTYTWNDAAWMAGRGARIALDAPVSIYEVHLGSWRRGENGRLLGYREIAPLLVEHANRLGFTHIELMPVMEHPYGASWGYQVTGYFAPTSRYGTPEDFMFLVDHLHERGIGVILDWVPGHFPSDAHGLAVFDGTHLYEHGDPRQGVHPEWKSLIFNYGRHEVRSFLLSNAMFWLDRYHADGLRVDGVASMLYLDYSRREGEWIPNVHGGRENIEAVEFLRELNRTIYAHHPDVQTIAEESTAWPMVSRPVHHGGLGFGLKWDMGWMHDTLRYFARDPVHRKHHHDDLTFRSLYAFHENFVLPLSHDEVVHGKRSLLGRMPGDAWQQLANLRLLFAQMFAQPGKKLLFMGGEIGERSEWRHDGEVDWGVLGDASHRGIQHLVGDLNRLYRGEPALHQRDTEPSGFEWVEANDAQHGVYAFVRRAHDPAVQLLVVLHCTPVPRHGYRVGCESGGCWREVLNTDAREYGGSGVGNLGAVRAEPVPWQGRPWSLSLTLPPLAALFLAPGGD